MTCSKIDTSQKDLRPMVYIMRLNVGFDHLEMDYHNDVVDTTPNRAITKSSRLYSLPQSISHCALQHFFEADQLGNNYKKIDTFR